MDVFTKLFGNLLAFVYHCFDRIVIHGYLSALSRPKQVVHFVRKIVGVPLRRPRPKRSRACREDDINAASAMYPPAV